MIKIAAVLPTYNNEDTIEECIKSLLNQTRKFDEIIVVDDGSTDNTPNILSKIKGIKDIGTTHVGRSAARNIGLSHANTEIVFFAEADAIYSEMFVEKCGAHFANPGVGGVIGKLEVLNPNSIWTRCRSAELNARFSNYKPFTGWMYRKQILERIGGFDENLTVGEDRNVGRKVTEMGYKIVYEPEAVWYHREPEKLLEIIMKRFRSGKELVKFYKIVGMPKLVLADVAAFSSLIFSIFSPLLTFIFFGYITAHLFFVRKYFLFIDKILWIHLSIYLVLGRLSYVLGRFAGFVKYGVPKKVSKVLLD